MLFLTVLSVLIGLNLFIAHLRDLYAIQDVTPGPTAIMVDTLDRPLQFAGIESLLLLVLGITCGALGTWEFFTNDDSYPGYGAMHRRLRETETAHADARRELLDDATDVRDTMLASLKQAMDRMQSYAQQRTDALAGRARYVTLYEAHEAELAQAARRLLTAYRDANTEVRRTPSPAHFRSVFAFSDQGIHHPAIVALLTDPPPPPNAAELVGQLEMLRENGLDAFNKLIALLPAEAS